MRNWRAIGLAGLALCGSAGCNFGEFIAIMMPGQKIKARYKLTTGPLLVLVDDDSEVLTWSGAADFLTDRVGHHLREAGANSSALTSGQVNALRMGDPGFAQRSIREVGQSAGATQVLWIRMVEFAARAQIDDARSANRAMVIVKVFDPNAESAGDVRLWPADREGEYVLVESSATVKQFDQNDDQVARELVEDLADKIARLFYTYREEK